MEIDAERTRMPPRETLTRSRVGCGLFFGLPPAIFGSLLLAVAFGPPELRQDLGSPPVWLVAAPGMLLTGLGVAFIGSGSRRRARKRRLERKRELSPESPWKWDHRWQVEGTRSAARRWTGKTLAFFVLGALFLTPFNFWAFVAGGPWLAKIVTALFDLLLVLALVGLGIAAVSYLKHGDPRLRFSSFPFRLGGELNVRLDRPRGIPGCTSIHCTLRCIEEEIEYFTERVREDGAWKNRRTSRTVCYQLWAGSEWHKINGHDPYLEVRFPLPQDERLGTRLSGTPPRYWELEVRGETAGLDYFATFLVPVYG